MSIARRLEDIRGRVQAAAEDSGRSPDEVQLLAVSKTYPAADVEEAFEAGQVLFGENRVQELVEKKPQLPDELSWHLIGPLQRNKVRKVVGECACLEAVDSLKLAGAIDRVAGELEVSQAILLQVKIGGEESKSGFEAESLRKTMDELVALPHLDIRGLMTIPPPVASSEEARPYFAQLRELAEELRVSSGLSLPELSMGMSGDFEAAIAEGSTMVRVGSAIFGERV